MNKTELASRGGKSTCACAIAIVLCLMFLAWVMKLWEADLTVPFSSTGDGAYYNMVVKSLIDNGWFWQNPFLGAPGRLDMYEFPMVDGFYFLVLKVITLFYPDYATALNLFFLLTFPLTTVMAFVAMRKFKISPGSSIVGSLLYTFLPYHFMRGEVHLFLSYYFLVPLAVVVFRWVYVEKDFFFLRENGRLKGNFQRAKPLAGVIICILVGSGGIYYAFFACFFLFVSGTAAYFQKKDVHALVASGILISVIFSAVLVNLSPSLVYNFKHEKNTEVAVRGAGEAEVYGMKITQLLLPVNDHRIPLLAKIKNRYNHAPLVNENSTATLGAVGSFGFLILIGWILYKKPEIPTLNFLSILNFSAVLLGTIGGFSALFALLVSPQIRSYNRISIYIAFFSLLAAFLTFEQIFTWLKKKITRLAVAGFLFYALLGLILIAGLFDQTTRGFVPDYARLKKAYAGEAGFVQRIEASVPPNAMIYQLPYIRFPENGRLHNMDDYEHLKGYLHSETLRWSYGAMKGREWDLWQRDLATKPVDEFVETVALAGFSGVYLNRSGYADRGAEMEAKLTALLGTVPIVSEDGNLVFIGGLADYAGKLKYKYPPQEFQTKQDQALHPLLFIWSGGFSTLEVSGPNTWRWCSSQGEMVIHNNSQQERKVVLDMVLSTGYNELSSLSIEGLKISERLPVNAKGAHFSKKLAVPPGRHVIQFASDAKKVSAPKDHRFLVFRVSHFSVRILE